jgi:dinuclear metal center YbgI/SA1388 family protein
MASGTAVIEPAELQAYCDTLLETSRFDDYCPNGLQVEGERPVRRIATGVSACQALIDAAIGWGADLLLVHHGYFWRGESPVLVGMKGRRVRSLMGAGVGLLAYHLPLDAHPEFGNNRQLGRVLGLREATATSAGKGLLWRGCLAGPTLADGFARAIAAALGRSPVHIAAGRDRPIQTLSWCTGGAQDLIEEAAALGVDAYLSGEISERTAHQARELGLDYFAAGHHATERYGVQALGAHLAERFGLQHRYFEVPNPA